MTRPIKEWTKKLPEVIKNGPKAVHEFLLDTNIEYDLSDAITAADLLLFLSKYDELVEQSGFAARLANLWDEDTAYPVLDAAYETGTLFAEHEAMLHWPAFINTNPDAEPLADMLQMLIEKYYQEGYEIEFFVPTEDGIYPLSYSVISEIPTGAIYRFLQMLYATEDSANIHFIREGEKTKVLCLCNDGVDVKIASGDMDDETHELITHEEILNMCNTQANSN